MKKRKNENIIMYILIAIAILVLGFTILMAFPSIQNNTQTVKSTSYKTVSTGTTEQGDVSIDLTPEEITQSKITIKITINTHTIDLTKYNLKQITTLEYNGQTIKPETAPEITGHHITGTMIFNIQEKPETYIIKITGIPKIQERIFTWNTKEE